MLMVSPRAVLVNEEYMEPEFCERRPRMVIDENGIMACCGWGDTGRVLFRKH
jgi:hypothetical protein